MEFILKFVSFFSTDDRNLTPSNPKHLTGLPKKMFSGIGQKELYIRYKYLHVGYNKEHYRTTHLKSNKRGESWKTPRHVNTGCQISIHLH